MVLEFMLSTTTPVSTLAKLRANTSQVMPHLQISDILQPNTIFHSSLDQASNPSK